MLILQIVNFAVVVPLFIMPAQIVAVYIDNDQIIESSILPLRVAAVGNVFDAV